MRMHKTMGIAVALLALAALAAPVQADQIIYDNGVPDLVIGAYSDFASPWESADDFVLQPAAATITDIHWWGFHSLSSNPPVDDFTIRIFEDAGGAPAATALHSFAVGNAVNRTDSGLTSFGNTVFEYEVDIAALALNPLTTYYLSIVNNTPNTSDFWAWVTSAQTGDLWQTDSRLGPAWNEGAFELAFNLTGPGEIVPEPASLSLLGLGLAGIAFRRFRKR